MIDLNYFAGFFDGEGSIWISSRSQLVVSVSQKNSDVLYDFKNYFNGEVHKSHRGVYQWKAYGNNALKFLIIIEPYLRYEKKSQAVYAIEFQKSRRGRGRKRTPTELERDIYFYTKVKELKQL